MKIAGTTSGCAALCAAVVMICGAPAGKAATDDSIRYDSALEQRLTLEKTARDSAWMIQPHRPNYILPVTYLDDPNEEPLREAGGKLQEPVDQDLQNIEIKFQISFKLLLWEDMTGGNGDLHFAYTQQSIWQAYNADASSPFRDSNYEPEFFAFFDTDYDVFGLRLRGVSLGAVHQSNGRGDEDLSRSWNRLYANLLFERGNFACTLKPWYRIPEDDEDDNNPNIEDYYGYGEFRAAYKHNDQVFATMLRNNFDIDENRGAIQVDWSFPLTKRFKGYIQYFFGYGETLLDYNHKDTRIGAGFLLSDWL
jgi:phospholipase A1